MKNVEKLLKEIQDKKMNWNERSSFAIKGVKNLSNADLDMIVLYANHFARHGNFQGLMKPLGNVKKVLEAYGIKEVNDFI